MAQRPSIRRFLEDMAPCFPAATGPALERLCRRPVRDCRCEISGSSQPVSPAPAGSSVVKMSASAGALRRITPEMPVYPRFTAIIRQPQDKKAMSQQHALVARPGRTQPDRCPTRAEPRRFRCSCLQLPHHCDGFIPVAGAMYCSCRSTSFWHGFRSPERRRRFSANAPRRPPLRSPAATASRVGHNFFSKKFFQIALEHGFIAP